MSHGIVGVPFGVRVIVGNYLEEFTGVPVKKLKIKRWMGYGNYYKRVQNKWVNRFGMKKERLYYRTNNSIIANQTNIDFLMSAIK